MSSPRSGLVQPADRANDEERDHAAVPVERRWRAPRRGSSLSFGVSSATFSRARLLASVAAFDTVAYIYLRKD